MHDTTSLGAEPHRNELLGALAPEDCERWFPHLQLVELAPGQVLCKAGETPDHVHFPVTALVSLMALTRDGGSAELAVVGHDGVVGIAAFMGGNAMPNEAVVQVGGLALRLRTQTLKSLLLRAGPALAMLLRYVQTLMMRLAQRALCNRYHPIDQQLCRRLLLGLDHCASDELEMTHEGTARLLGVRREGVTAASLGLQRAGVIRYHRGHIHVLDRAALERGACGCYAARRNEHTSAAARLQFDALPLSPV